LGQLSAVLVFSSAVTFFIPLTVAVMQVMRKIKGLTALETFHKFFTSLATVALLLLGYGVFGIVVGNLISMVVFSLVGAWLYRRLRRGQDLLPRLRDLPFIKLSWGKIKYFFQFGFQIALSKNIVKLNSQIPFLMLGAVLATNSGLAFYKIAFAYMAIPSFLLAPISRLLNVQFPQTEELRGDKRLFKRFWQVSGLSILLTLGLTIIMVALGPFLIKFFYGADFSPAIKIMYGLALYPIFLSAGVGLGPLFRTLNKMKAAIIINFITWLLLIPSAVILINNYAIVGLVAVTLIFTFIPNFLSFIYLYTVSRTI
jgi:O-antigen/teichoic acid export membrane protein